MIRPLTPQEIEIMWLIADGLTNDQIAKRLAISKHTVKFHIYNLLNKFDSRCRTNACAQFVLMNVEEARRRFAMPQEQQPSA